MSKLILICGPSGCGKSTLLNDSGLIIPKSYTTRPSRGKEPLYDFVETLPDIEYAERIWYDGYEYGISRDTLKECLERGDTGIVVSIEGLRQLLSYNPESYYIDAPQFVPRRVVDAQMEAELKQLCTHIYTLEEAKQWLEHLRTQTVSQLEPQSTQASLPSSTKRRRGSAQTEQQ